MRHFAYCNSSPISSGKEVKMYIKRGINNIYVDERIFSLNLENVFKCKFVKKTGHIIYIYKLNRTKFSNFFNLKTISSTIDFTLKWVNFKA